MTQEICPACNGRGKGAIGTYHWIPCSRCGGRGTRDIMSSGTAASDPLLGMIAGGLAALHHMHTVTSGRSYPSSMQPTPENVRTYGLALLDEVHEFLKELQWKPWKTSEVVEHLINESHIDCDQCRVLRDTIAEEFADILVFLGLFIGYLEKMGMNAEVLAQAFLRKTAKNKERLAGKGDHPGYKDMTYGISD